MIAAATASITGLAPTPILFLAILAGLVASDAWKYWLGHAARSHAWAHKFAEKPGVSVAGDLVRNELIRTMYMARFVPGTRVPTYVACGFFQTPYVKFVGILVMTAFTYVCIWMAIFHTVGAVAGEQARFVLPAIAVLYVSAYVLYRWMKHRKGRLGPMTPISPEFDHPLPDAPGFEGNPLEGHEGDAARDGAQAAEEERAAKTGS